MLQSDKTNTISKYWHSPFRKDAILLLSFLIIPILCTAQKDSTKKSMSFDFGLTRDRNINLWPVFKRTISKYEKDKQLLFPIYRSYQNIRRGEKRSHLLPIFWQDSSNNQENLRIISTYYPSLIHLSKDQDDQSKTFTLLEFAPRINLLEFKKSPDGLVMQNNLLFFLWYQNNLVNKKSYLVVFPVYWQFKTPKDETTTLFPIYSYGSYSNGKKQYRAVTPLFWHLESPKQKSNLLFPLWWNKRITAGKDSSSSNYVFPIFWSHKDRYTNNNVIFPIAWSINNARYNSFTIAPLLSYGHSNDLDRSHLIITPFYMHFKNQETETTTLFPIVWKSTWDTRYEHIASLVVFPFYWEQKNNDNLSRILLPFVWVKSTPNYHSFSFIPLLSVGQSPDKSTTHTIITPLFWHYKSPTITSNTLFPIWWKRTKPMGNDKATTNIIFPLYWGKKDPSYQRNILFPLVWNFKNPEYRTFTFVPFVSAGKSTDGKGSYLAVSPLFWSFKTEQGKGKFLFPIWWQNDRTINGELKSSSRVVLLYWSYWDNIRRFKGVFPIVWSIKNETTKSFTIFPIYIQGESGDSTRKYLAVTPLYWHFKNPQRTFSTLFPIWWDAKDNNKSNPGHFNLLVPLYYAKWDNIESKKILFPIIWSLKNTNYQSFTFVPLFSFGKSIDQEVQHLAITPLFWYFKNSEGYSASLIPVFWHSKFGDGESAVKWNVLFPIYWSNKDSDQSNRVLFPILWSFNNDRYKSLTIAPIFSYGYNLDKSEHHTIVTPLFYSFKGKKSSSNVLFPIWWSSKKTAGKKLDRTDIIFPIYFSHTDPNKSTRVFLPLIWDYRTPKTYSFTVAPVFSKGLNIGGEKYTMITPLFWKFDSKSKHSRILFPLFTSYNDTLKHKRFDVLFILLRHSSIPNSTSTSIVWPIIERTKGVNYRYFRFAPLVWSKKSPAYSYFTIQPFYYRGVSKEQATTRIFWELFVHRDQFNQRKSDSFLWKVATWDRYANGDKETRFLYLLYSNMNVDGNIEKSLFPFYYLTKDKNGNRSLSVFLYFYNSLKRQVPNTKEYYQEVRIFWLIRIRSNYKILQEKGIRVD
jgi:hypothetical protein